MGLDPRPQYATSPHLVGLVLSLKSPGLSLPACSTSKVGTVTSKREPQPCLLRYFIDPTPPAPLLARHPQPPLSTSAERPQDGPASELWLCEAACQQHPQPCQAPHCGPWGYNRPANKLPSSALSTPTDLPHTQGGRVENHASFNLGKGQASSLLQLSPQGPPPRPSLISCWALPLSSSHTLLLSPFYR